MSLALKCCSISFVRRVQAISYALSLLLLLVTMVCCVVVEALGYTSVFQFLFIYFSELNAAIRMDQSIR